MGKQTKYCVVSSSNTNKGWALYELEEVVNNCLESGWKLHGSVSISSHRRKVIVAQALTMDVEKE